MTPQQIFGALLLAVIPLAVLSVPFVLGGLMAGIIVSGSVLTLLGLIGFAIYLLLDGM